MVATYGLLAAAEASAQSGRKPPEKARKAQQNEPTPAPEPKPVEPEPPPLTQKELDEAVRLGVNVVNVETVVVEKKTGIILQNLRPENFEILEDGVKQEITNFAPTQGPITLVIVIEFSKIIQDPYFIGKGELLRPAWYFISEFVKPKDNVAIVAFDMRPEVITDFTGDVKRLQGGIDLLARNYPAFSESNLYDAIKFVLVGGKARDGEYAGLAGVEGRSAILLVSLGRDTFSKINYDEARRVVARAGVPIYCIGVGNLFYKKYEVRMTSEQTMIWQQAFATLKTFARMSGGRYYPVTFEGELPSTLRSIQNLLRSQYSLGYAPSNTRREGKMRKIQVRVDVDGDGVFGDKGYELQFRESYLEPDDRKG
jgi:VWFA-related protein